MSALDIILILVAIFAVATSIFNTFISKADKLHDLLSKKLKMEEVDRNGK